MIRRAVKAVLVGSFFVFTSVTSLNVQQLQQKGDQDAGIQLPAPFAARAKVEATPIPEPAAQHRNNKIDEAFRVEDLAPEKEASGEVKEDPAAEVEVSLPPAINQKEVPTKQ